MKRIELLLTIHGLTNSVNIDEVLRNTSIHIKYNTFEDSTEMLNLVTGLNGVVSQETLLGLLGDIIVSVEDEMDKLAAEKEDNMARFGFMQNANGHMKQEEEEEPVEDEQEEPIEEE